MKKYSSISIETENKKYISRCIQLAQKGIGNVSPNPMVGAVIVYNNKIIGEGYHKKFGEAHAEVNAINSVSDKSLLQKSTLYVSLEPCSHVGKTPACTDLIIKTAIPNVVIGSIDPYFEVAGKGIEKLKNAGINVETEILKDECIFLNRRFYTFHTKKRPYIILKWAQTSDGFIDAIRKSKEDILPKWITNELSKTLVHKWRTEEDAILTGKNTVIKDNPQLTARNWFGHNPIRIVIDKMCELNKTYNIFDIKANTLIFNALKDEKTENIDYIKINFNKNVVQEVLHSLYNRNIQSIIIEGGTKTLNEFINQNLWDETRLFIGKTNFGNGIPAPVFIAKENENYQIENTELKIFYNTFANFTL